MLGIERVMDHIAHALGRTRWRCGGSTTTPRRRGAKTEGAGDPYGQPVEDFVLHDMTERLETNADYAAPRRAWRRGTPRTRC
jgi:xanthine dehydrogenase large subunit